MGDALNKAFAYAGAAAANESAGHHLLAFAQYLAACNLFDSCVDSMEDESSRALVKRQTRELRRSATTCRDVAIQGKSGIDFAFALSHEAKQLDASPPSPPSFVDLCVVLYTEAVATFLESKAMIPDPKSRKLIEDNCDQMLTRVEALTGRTPRPRPRPAPAPSPPASHTPKTFANLRRTDPELSASGPYGREFTRAQTMLERGWAEIKGGMRSEAEDHLLDGVAYLLRLLRLCSDATTRAVLRQQAGAALTKAEQLRAHSTLQSRRQSSKKVFALGAGGSREFGANARKAMVVDMAAVKRALRPFEEGGLFADPAFPHSPASIGGALAKQVSAWKRPKALFASPSVYKEGVSATDIRQGAVGDCWLVVVFSCLATRPNLFQKLISPRTLSGCGAYAVRLYIEGRWQYVLIDDALPSSPYAPAPNTPSPSGLFPVFASSKNEGELWVSLVEKAWAKMLGGYANLGGDALHVPGKSSRQAFVDFTGGYAESECLVTSEAQEQVRSGELFARMVRRKQQGWLMSCGSKLKEDLKGIDDAVVAKGYSAGEDISALGIVYGHAYAVLEVVQAAGQQLVKLRNPWGSVQWKGKWGPGSKEWKTSVGKQVISSMSKAQRVGNVDAGSFWMDFAQFAVYFDIVHYCKLVDHLQESVVRGVWYGAACGGQEYFPSWRDNPQFTLTVSSPTSLFMVLDQSDPRFSDLDQVPIGFGIWKTTHPGRRLLQASKADEVATTPYGRAEIHADLPTIAPGTYTVVVSTISPKQQQAFTLRAYSEHAVQLSAVDTQQSDWAQMVVNGEWAQGRDGGLGNVNNPRYVVDCKQATTLFFSLQAVGGTEEGWEKKLMQVQVFDNCGASEVVGVRYTADGRIADPPQGKTPLALHFETCGRVDVRQGKWLVVLCSSQSVVGVRFRLKVYSDVKVGLRAV